MHSNPYPSTHPPPSYVSWGFLALGSSWHIRVSGTWQRLAVSDSTAVQLSLRWQQCWLPPRVEVSRSCNYAIAAMKHHSPNRVIN